MKKTYLFAVISLALSCKEHKGTADYNTDNSCECERTIKTDSILYASNITIENNSGMSQITFNCAEIDVAIASVSDESGGNEVCTNLYDVRCSSKKNHQISLASNFTYFTDQKENQQDPKKLFFDDLREKKIQYFKFYLNRQRKLQSASQIILD